MKCYYFCKYWVSLIWVLCWAKVQDTTTRIRGFCKYWVSLLWILSNTLGWAKVQDTITRKVHQPEWCVMTWIMWIMTWHHGAPMNTENTNLYYLNAAKYIESLIPASLIYLVSDFYKNWKNTPHYYFQIDLNLRSFIYLLLQLFLPHSISSCWWVT